MAKTNLGKKVTKLVEQADKLVADIKADAKKLVDAARDLKDAISDNEGPKPA